MDDARFAGTRVGGREGETEGDTLYGALEIRRTPNPVLKTRSRMTVTNSTP